jgi:hypothetical protein
MQLRNDIVSLFVVGISVALVGFGMVYLSAKFESEREERRAKRFGEH